MAGQRHVQASGVSFPATLSVKSVQSAVKNRIAFLPRIARITRMNRSGDKKANLCSKIAVLAFPLHAGRTNGTSNLALSNEKRGKMRYAFFLAFCLVGNPAYGKCKWVRWIEFEVPTRFSSDLANTHRVPGNNRIADTSNIVNSQDVNSLFSKCDGHSNSARFSLFNGTPQDLRQEAFA